MAKTEYHINDQDEVKPCSARIKCKFGDVEHYASEKDAERGLEQRLGNPCGAMKKSKQKAVKKAPDTVSASISREYGHISVLTNHLHNSSDTGSLLEQYYYNSPAGRLELKRRIGINKKYNDDYVRIQEQIDAEDFKIDGVDTLMAEKKEHIENMVVQGREKVGKDFGDNHDKLLDTCFNRESPDEMAPVQHFLVEESSKWYSTLSTEEQEAIGHLTSNGFKKLQYHIGEIDKSKNPKSHFGDVIDMDKILFSATGNDDPYETMREESAKYAEKYHALVMSAMSKSVKLDEPVMTYRGTTMNEVLELLGQEKTDLDSYQDDGIEANNRLIKSLVENNQFVGKEVHADSRLRKIPVSTTVSPEQAKRFGEEVYLEIKRTTSSSPVNNGAWGSKEQEMLSNPLSNYKIVGAKRIEDSDIVPGRYGLVLQLEEIPTD